MHTRRGERTIKVRERKRKGRERQRGEIKELERGEKDTERGSSGRRVSACKRNKANVIKLME